MQYLSQYGERKWRYTLNTDEHILIGSLVRGTADAQYYSESTDPDEWVGIVIGYRGTNPVVYWSDKFPAEIEYASQLQVVA